MAWGDYVPVSTSSWGTPGDPNAAIRQAAEKRLLEQQLKPQQGVAVGAAAQRPAVPSFQAYSQQTSGPVSMDKAPVQASGQPYPVGGVSTGASGAMPVATQQPSVYQPSQPLVNTSVGNPGLDQSIAALNARTQQQQGREGQTDPLLQEQINALRERRSTDTTQHATEQAVGNARDAASAIGRAKDYQLAQRGIAGSGAESGVRSQISDAAARASAKAAADIQMNELGRQDQLVLGGQGIMAAPGQERLQREGATNAMLNAGVGAAKSAADLGLSQQELGLKQYLGQGQLNLDQARVSAGLAQSNRSQALQEWEAMLRAAGY